MKHRLVLALFPAAMASATLAQQPALEAPLKDKTLVVWAAPANLTQRGGSALTIDDGREIFDAVVFGEIAPAKWMAGSDFYRRTLRDQAVIPVETADAGTFVQMAIVYAGKQITVYRNGQLYSQHTMAEEPQEFGPTSRVYIGKRHRKQSDPSRFAGAIDDARIYAQALSAEQIAALKPNEASAVKPWAWWSFDDQDARDRTGRFLISELAGGATVKDGTLVLDGGKGEFNCGTGKEVPFTYETPARPAEVPANWLTYHLAHPGPGQGWPGDPNCAFFWKGRYHLHYIYNHRDGFSFAHVSSDDMLHWKWECFAPESLLTADGRRVMWAWCHLEYPQTGMQSLPRELSLPDDGILRIKPLRELEKLRHDEKSVPRVSLQSDAPYQLPGITGDTLELQLTFQPGTAKAFGLEVYCDAAGRDGFPITIEPAARTLHLGAVAVPFELKPGESANLRVFLDKSMIEVFVNDRQAAVASHRYTDGNLGIQLISQGGGTAAMEVKAWGMNAIYADVTENQ